MTTEILSVCLALGLAGSASLLAPMLWRPLAAARVAVRAGSRGFGSR